MLKNKITVTIIAFLIFSICSCKKVLDAKPDVKLAIPEKLSDLQALLDYDPFMVLDLGSDEVSADNYFVLDTDYDAFGSEYSRQEYNWRPSVQFPVSSEWGIAYRKVFYANEVLEALQNIEQTPANLVNYNNIKGQALFVRGFNFWKIANIWAPAYDDASSSSDLGIPLRLNTDFNEVSVRANVKGSYDQILRDLTESAKLLPTQSLQAVRASKPAAYAVLARVYLSMRKYTEAGAYADSSLQLNNKLMDYNSLNANDAYPIQRFNDETLQYSYGGATPIATTIAKVDSTLYRSYDNNDLRKTVFFKSAGSGQFFFKGSYANSQNLFEGIATDEMYLTRAECNARAGNTAKALDDLNALLKKRFKTGLFVNVTATIPADALAKILEERRKELIFRFTRWMDIKRLNKEGAGIILKRLVHGISYTLPPNDLRYALPIPDDIIALSGMTQNPR